MILAVVTSVLFLFLGVCAWFGGGGGVGGWVVCVFVCRRCMDCLCVLSILCTGVYLV